MTEDVRAPDVDAHVGRRLRALRMAAGLSLSALAARMGVSYQQLQKYETGLNRMSAGQMYEACRALGVGAGVLFEGLPGPERSGPAALVRLEAVLESPGGRELMEAFLSMPMGLRRQYAALAARIVDPADPAPALLRPSVAWAAGAR